MVVDGSVLQSLRRGEIYFRHSFCHQRQHGLANCFWSLIFFNIFFWGVVFLFELIDGGQLGVGATARFFFFNFVSGRASRGHVFVCACACVFVCACVRECARTHMCHTHTHRHTHMHTCTHRDTWFACCMFCHGCAYVCMTCLFYLVSYPACLAQHVSCVSVSTRDRTHTH